MKLFVLAALTLFSSQIGWLSDFDDAKAEAAKSDKAILINFSGSDWCIPCIKLEKQVFETPVFEDYASGNLVLVKADFPRLKKNKLPREQVALNEKLASIYNPEGKFPYTVLVDKEGKVLKEWDGFPGSEASKFIGDINAYIHGK